MTPSCQLKAEVEHADAMMLLNYLQKRTTPGPLTLVEALEAIHRNQGPTINMLDAGHMHLVVARLSLAGVPVDIGKPVPPLDITKAFESLERLPMIPTTRIILR